MKTSSRPIQRTRRGYALAIVLCSLAVMLIVFASMMYWITSNSRVTARNNQYNMSEAAAEAAAEKVLSQMNFDYVAQSLSNNGTYYSSQFLPSLTNEQAGWPIKYVYSDTNGLQNQISVYLGPWTTNTVPLGSQYTNLYGLEQDCNITVTATPLSNNYPVSASIREGIQFAAIPVFQFAIFYNMNLEIAAAQSLTVVGPVWSNGGLWSGSSTVTFQNSVSAVGIVSNMVSDPFCSNYTGSGKSTYSMAGQPTSGNDRITMPIGTNNDPTAIEALIDLPPATYALNTAAAFTTNGQIYFANGADLFLTNFPNGTNWGSLSPRGTNMILYFQDVNNNNGTLNYWIQLPYDFYLVTNRMGTNHSVFTTNFINPTTSTTNTAYCNSILYAGYSFLTNVLFYDWREGWNGGSGPPKAVQAVQIDVGKYNIWLTNSTASNGCSQYNTQCSGTSDKSHPIDSIYIYNNVPLTGTTLPAVRVVNGTMLPTQTAPKGFTIATKQPIYVLGNYNATNTSGSDISANSTSYTWPAGLMGDAITILSGSWNDSTTTKLPTASSTTVNAAILAGIVQSTNTLYSGGVENFLRTLESWGSSGNLWYNGSIVVMFPSRFATNYWQQTGNYYAAPNRHWAFDTNFTLQVGLPPLTPQSKGVIRYNWTAY